MEKNLWKHVQLVRDQSPLVHNITNYVVMNTTANALLAIGASPIMSHAISEVKEMLGISKALVINIGTMDEYWADVAQIAANTAYAEGKPWVLDPVGAGATTFRDKVLADLLTYHPTVVRGNASEIISLAKANKAVTKGVDSTAESIDAMDAAKSIHLQFGSVVCVSGDTDIIIDSDKTTFIKNGHPLMTKVTGLGCCASAIVGAFVGVIGRTSEAVAAAMCLIGIAGELAAQYCAGPGSLQVHLLDKLYNITEKEFLNQAKVTRV